MPPAPVFSTMRTHVAGVPIADLARQFGTPVFVYDAATIVRRLEDLRAFDVVRYAQKACSNLAVLDLMRRHGALVDAVSAGEVQRAMAAGYLAQGDPPPIVYTADVFDAESLELVLAENVHVNCGSPDMIDQYGSRAPGREITLRVNLGFGHGHSRKTNTGGDRAKHGIWHEQLPDCLVDAEHYGLGVTGLHVHIGSGTDLEHLAQVCGAMEATAEVVGRNLRSISAGGGLPIPYREDESYVDLDEYFRLWNATRQRLEARFGHPIRLEIEPGRYLVAESGILVTEIRAVKKQGENLFYLVDAGFNNLARPILYGAYHPISIAPADADTRRPLVDAIVGGPLCESGDVFTRDDHELLQPRQLPRPQVGDLLVLHDTGAYGLQMSSHYNSLGRAPQVWLEDGRLHLAARRETLDDIVRAECFEPLD